MDIFERLQINDFAKEAILKCIPQASTVNNVFIFSKEEFEKHIRYKMIELDNGGIIIAPSEKFHDVFDIRSSEVEDEVEVTTQGKIVNSKLRKGL